MKFYVLEGRHLVPLGKIPAELRQAHFDFLAAGYERGQFLVSGPKIGSEGGYLVARSESRDALDRLLMDEPFTSNGVMVFETVTEFFPRQHLPEIAWWARGDGE